MRRTCWFLFALSVLTMLLGAVSRFGPQPLFAGVDAGTFWKASMAFLAYAITLRLLVSETRPA